MDDTIDEIVAKNQTHLLDNLLTHDKEYYIKYLYNHTDSLHYKTKDMIVKEGLLAKVIRLIIQLNAEFPDVRFWYEWSKDSYQMCERQEDYNLDYIDVDLKETDNHTQIFFDEPLSIISMKLFFSWERQCDLGCIHKTTRFYIINVPKLISILGAYDAGCSVRELIKINVPDFFYDPLPRHAHNFDKLD